jgi:FKBP-type peptidyl-prolyl cis-trans isomerase 2
MSQIERNSLVTIFYRLGLTNGDVLEDNFDDEPMTVQLGRGEMAEGLELALIGLREGQEETIDIGPDLAFGYVEETLFRSIPRVEFDPELELEPGLISRGKRCATASKSSPSATTTSQRRRSTNGYPAGQSARLLRRR